MAGKVYIDGNVKIIEQMELRANTLRDIRDTARAKVRDLLSEPEADSHVLDLSMNTRAQTGAVGTYTDEHGYVGVITVMYDWHNVDRDGMILIEWDKTAPIITDK